ncbi:unannotated protein [freshwater metagenome]|uniref:Unannotated protein n=1 Tax=freshwater metagenome TaxID=449393 RepID=A0A6J6JXM9_9ZZZZ
MIDGVAHPSNLSVSTFVNRETEDPRAEESGLGWRGDSIFEHDALAKHAKFATCRFSFDVGDVFLLDPKGWMR